MKYKVPDSYCTNCGKLLDRARAVDRDEGPTPGSFTVCVHCEHLMVFDNDLSLRDPTAAESKSAADQEILQRAREAIRRR